MRSFKAAAIIAMGGAVIGIASAADQPTAQDVASAADTGIRAGQNPAAPISTENSTSAELSTIPVKVGEDAAAPDSPAPARSRLIEEVIVTAQKREENLQDVPISVTAFSAEALDARGVGQASDLPRITPGLQYDNLAGFSIIYLRGVGSDAFVSGDPSVATYLDDIYLPQNHGSSQAFGSVKRVEVLKGPQGTLFGRNATGGAINVITPEPEDMFKGAVQLASEAYDHFKSNAYITGPIVDTVTASLAVVYNAGGENWYSHTEESPIQDFLEGKEKGARLKLAWKPTDNIEASLAGLTYRARASRYNVFVLEEPSPLLGPALALAGVRPDRGDPYEVGQSSAPFNYTYNDLAYTKLRYSSDALDIKLSASYQDTYTNAEVDFDGSSGDLVFIHANRQDALVKTYELQLVSNDTSWAADQFRWIVGLYRFESTQGTYPADIGVLADTITVPVLSQLFPGVIPEHPIVRTGTEQDTKSTAAFFQATYNLIDTVALTLGGRYQYETRDRAESGGFLLSADESVTRLTHFPPRSLNNTNFAPRAVLDWKPVADTLFYASYSKAYKSGTFNLVDVLIENDAVRPEEVSAIELGAKISLFDHRVQINTAVFRNSIQDLQTQFIGLTSGGIVSLENAASARIRGADADLLWSITPSIVLTANAAVLDSQFNSYEGGTGFDPATGLFRRNFDFSGNKIPRSPKFTGNLGLSYTTNLGDGVAEVGGDVYHNSGYFYDNQNSVDTSAYTLLNARVSYRYEPWKLRVSVFGTNLTDETYHIVRFRYDLGVLGTLASPVNYGVRLQWDF